MIFEVGKYYRHATGLELSIVGKINTTMFGETLIAEHTDNIDFIAVGSNEASAENYKEITKEEWMKNFSTV